MRFGFVVTVSMLVLAAVPLRSSADTAVSYQVTYGAKDLGAWNTLVAGKSKSGTYLDDGTFESSNGPGFPTLQLTRALSAVDRESLFSSLPPANGPLVIRAVKSGTADVLTTCDKSIVADFENMGDPGTGTETIVFGCTVPPKAAPATS